MKQYVLETSEQKYIVQIIRSKRKTVGFSVTPKGEIKMRIPKGLPHDHIAQYIKQKEQWLIKTCQKLIEQESLETNFDFRHNGNIHLLGYDRKIIFTIGLQQNYQLSNDQLIFYVHHMPSEKQQSLYIQKWLKSFSLEYYQQRTKQLIDCFDPPVDMPEICIRKMRRTWGNIRKNNIMTLAHALIYLPKAAIDHVILHELCHMIHFDHSPAFHQLLKSVDKNYDENKSLLKYYRDIMTP